MACARSAARARTLKDFVYCLSYLGGVISTTIFVRSAPCLSEHRCGRRWQPRTLSALTSAGARKAPDQRTSCQTRAHRGLSSRVCQRAGSFTTFTICTYDLSAADERWGYSNVGFHDLLIAPDCEEKRPLPQACRNLTLFLHDPS